jgi:hypothetical protein
VKQIIFSNFLIIFIPKIVGFEKKKGNNNIWRISEILMTLTTNIDKLKIKNIHNSGKYKHP